MAKHQVRAGLPTRTVALNLRRLREQRGLSVRTLARMSAFEDGAGGVPPNGVHEIENGLRRVDVDDLMALAVALDVSPCALLMPVPERPDDSGAGVVHLRDDEPLDAQMVWGWLTAEEPLRTESWWEALEETETEKPEANRHWYDAVMRESWRRRFAPRFAWKREGESND